MIKKTPTYRLFALLMAGIVFLSSIGLAFDTHVCQDKLRSISFLGNAENCYELAGYSNKTCQNKSIEQFNDPESKTHTGCSVQKKDCCKNQFHYFQSDIDFQTQTVELEITPQLKVFFLSLIHVFLQDKSYETTLIPYLNYKPPLLLRDIPILVQSFLL